MRRTSHNLLFVIAVCMPFAAGAAVPEALHFSGKLDTGGTGYTGTVSVVFTLYTDPTSTDSDVWTDTQSLSASEGRFQTELSGVTHTMLAGGILFLGIQVESDPEMSPRIALRSVPYARQADNALTLDGNPASAFSTTDTQLSSGEVLAMVAGGGYVTGAHTTDTKLNEAEVEGFITNGAINLAAGSQIDGVDIATGPHVAISPANTIIVSATGGDYTDLKIAVDSVADWCTGATATNRCLIRLMPGTYAVSSSLVIPAHMDIVGQGAENTVISRTLGNNNNYLAAAVLQMGNETSLRELTVKNTGGGTKYVTGLYMDDVRVGLDRVIIDVSGGAEYFGTAASNYGVYANDVTVLTIEDSIITTTLGTGTARNHRGIHAPQDEGASLHIWRSTISAIGGSERNVAIYAYKGVQLTDVTVTSTGAGAVENVALKASGGTSIIDRSRIISDDIAVQASNSSTVVRAVASRISGVASSSTATLTCTGSFDAVSDARLSSDCSVDTGGGVSHPISTANTAIVSATGGDYTGPKAAVDDVDNWCTGATADNRCLLRLMPGTYALDAVLSIPPFMDVEGQGAENTVISRTSGSASNSMAAVLRMYKDTSLRRVTIKNTGGNTPVGMGVYTRASETSGTGTVDLVEVAIDVSGATNYNYGVYAHYLLNVSITDSTISAHLGSAASCNYSYGVHGTAQTDGASLDITGSRITVTGCSSGNRGIQPERDSTVTDVSISASGDGAIGIRNYLDPLVVNRCTITSTDRAIYRYTGSVKVTSSTLTGSIYGAGGGASATYVTCLDSKSGSGKTLAADCTETLSTTDVPIGTVISWYRPDTTTDVPKGYAICDGSLINESRSPWDGKQLPSLNNKFVRGVTSESNINTSGGSDTHTHTTALDHNHPSATSASGGASHTHNYSKTHDHPSVNTNTKSDTHNHIWAYFDTGEKWWSYNSSGNSFGVMDYNNGIGDSGSGNYPFAANGTFSSTKYYYTGEHSDSHSHTANVANYSSPTNNTGSTTASHTHGVDLPNWTGAATSSSDSNVPAYVGLLQIMRIY